ncbi:hypothetical protein N7523_007088 [Penicillium sp. IBT 18751x]|nr:hypothetical protein N7523_007088 [Penicillium sp. IBT 18751x]
MKVIYHDFVQMPRELESVSDATYHKSMNTLSTVSGCVVVATSFSGETLLAAFLILTMKKGFRLINIARRKLLDDSALIDALKRGQLSAAGLDVNENENEPHVKNELGMMKMVETLSHNAGTFLNSHVLFERLN